MKIINQFLNLVMKPNIILIWYKMNMYMRDILIVQIHYVLIQLVVTLINVITKVRSVMLVII